MKKHRESTAKLLLASIVLTAGMSMTTWAAEWKQDTTGWWYEQDGGGYTTGWNWIDGKCYYFDTNGYMAVSTEVDGYTLNENGQWTVDGIVQTQTTPVTDGKSISQITLNQNLTDLLGVSDGANSLKDKRVVEQDEFRTVYMMDYNGRQLNISVTKLDNAPTTYTGEVDSILKNVPQTGIELNAFYDNTGFKDADNGRRIVASTGRSDQIFGLATGTYRMTRCNVENKHFEIVLTQGTDGNWYIYPNSATYIQIRY